MADCPLDSPPDAIAAGGGAGRTPTDISRDKERGRPSGSHVSAEWRSELIYYTAYFYEWHPLESQVLYISVNYRRKALLHLKQVRWIGELTGREGRTEEDRGGHRYKRAGTRWGCFMYRRWLSNWNYCTPQHLLFFEVWNCIDFGTKCLPYPYSDL